uniref:Reverse transcriptase Ty1/copia-type domain-containing protein n=1 Tax=Tanacetum cinerariifolium TaxID=118510 RepID=A0A6L2L2N4_TANCI|nr:hypothetical protein [Tanacetum cinerariifolium]
MESLSPQVVAAAKLPILNPNEFDLVVDGVVQSIAPTTAEQRLAKKNELKSKGTLLMALPDKHQLKFNIHKDAKSLRRLLRREVKSSSSTSPTTKNIAFVSSQNTDSTNESISVVTSVFTASTNILVFVLPNVVNLSDAVIYSFFASQSNSPQLDNDDLKQTDADDPEDMDLKWQMAMLTMRARRFLQRTRRNLGANGTTSIWFDMSKVEYYNCYRRGQFAREYRSPRDTRNKDTQRRNVQVENSTSNALVSQCDGVGSYDWSFQEDEEPTNYSLMAFTSSSSSNSDNEVASCSKACSKAYATLPSHYDNLTNDLRKSHIDVISYETCLESVKARLVVYQQNKNVFEEDIKLLKLDVMLRDNALGELRKKFEKAEQKRDDIVFDCDELISSELDVGMPTSPVHDSETVPTVLNVEPSPTKPNKDLSQSNRPSAPNIEDSVSDSEDESAGEPMPTQKAPSFVQPSERVKTPRPSVNPVEHPTPTINLRKDISKSREINGGYVAFGRNPKAGKITGKGIIRIGKLDFDDVYFVKELKFNLCSVSQMCDKKNSVHFIDTECVVLSSDFKLPDENHQGLNFLENQPNVAGSGPIWLFDIDTLTQSMNYQPVVAQNQPNSSVDPQNIDVDDVFADKENESEVYVSPSSSDKPKKHDDKAKREAKGKSHVDVSTGVRDLSDEFKEFFVNSTNRVNAASTPVIAVGPNSTNSTNSFNDANMPALEDITYSDDEEDVGVEADFSNLETHIPVSPILTTRVHKDHPVTQIIGDLSLATQTRSMERMVKEQGFEDLDYPDKVYKVVKALYGLHQAPKAWYETLANYLLKNGFQRGKIDQTLFIKKQKGDILLVQMSSMGELTFFLGLQVKQKPDGIFINQDKYVAEILRKFGLTKGKSASTPIDTKKPLLKDPDVKRIFRYLKGKPHLGLWYPKDSPFNLVAYFDSDYAGASLDRKSITGGCQFLGCRLISWQCKKQTVVSTSSTEAEYVAVRSNDVVRLQSLIDRKKVVIIEDSIRQAFRLDDADGVDCLPNEEIFAELARMGYVKPIGKGFSGVDTPLFNGMLVPQQAQDVEDAAEDEADVNEVSAEPTLPSPTLATPPPPQQEHITPPPSPTQEHIPSPPQALTAQPSFPQQQQPLQAAKISITLLNTLLETSATLTKQVANLEQNKIAQAIEITKLKQRVKRVESSADTIMDDQEDASKQEEKIVELDADEDITLEKVDAEVATDADVQGRLEESQAKVYHLDLKHAEKVLTIKDTDEAEPVEVEEVIEVVTSAKLMTEVVTTAATTITVVQVPKASALRRRRSVIIQDLEEDATASARKNMMVYLKNMVGFKIDFFRGMTYTHIRPIFEKNYNFNQAFLERVEEEVTCQEEEGCKRKDDNLKQRAANKQKINEETEELKTHP